MENFKIERVFAIVLDSVGIGALPDAANFGDAGADTLGHVAAAVGGLKMPHMERMGLGHIRPIEGIARVEKPLASFGKMAEASQGKDTMAGHWEIMGLITDKPFPVFKEGFDREFMDRFLADTGLPGYLGNKAASGTVIIQELGDKHVETGYPIVYTSADSVFQVAAHEEVIPVPELYRVCEKARIICDDYQVGRVIARPFTGKKSGEYKRTANRKDFPMKPPGETALDILKRNGVTVSAIGKIEDIYAGRGISRAIHTKDNAHGMRTIMEEMTATPRGFIFTNLVDFDMVYGHRNNPGGYAGALEEFDAWLGEFLPLLGHGDLLIITADHGCDPLHPGTDHTREYVPLLVYNPRLQAGDLGIRDSFADVGATVLDIFGIPHALPGKSLLN